MNDLTISMNELSLSSKETQKNVKTIVVAEEVRNLALRSAEAAKTTAGLIDNIANKINIGSELVNKTSSGYKEVEVNAVKVGELLQKIATAFG